jgi:WD40 repeat protein
MGIAMSPDGKQIAIGYRAGHIRLWDTESGNETRRIAGHGEGLAVSAVAMSPSGELLATGVVNWYNGRNPTDDEQAMAILKGYAGLPTELKLWDLRTGKERASLVGNDATVLCVAFSPDGKLIASGGEDRIIRLWNVETRELKSAFVAHRYQVDDLQFAPDGNLLASCSADATVKLWDVKSILAGEHAEELSFSGGQPDR